MKPLDMLKLALLLVALAIWAWGVRTNENGFMLVGIVFVLIAFLLRFVPRLLGRRTKDR